MDENFDSETSFAKEITKEIAKSVAATVIGNAAGIALFVGIGLAAKKIQDRKARKEENKKN